MIRTVEILSRPRVLACLFWRIRLQSHLRPPNSLPITTGPYPIVMRCNYDGKFVHAKVLYWTVTLSIRKCKRRDPSREAIELSKLSDIICEDTRTPSSNNKNVAYMSIVVNGYLVKQIIELDHYCPIPQSTSLFIAIDAWASRWRAYSHLISDD